MKGDGQTNAYSAKRSARNPCSYNYRPIPNSPIRLGQTDARAPELDMGLRSEASHILA